MDVTDSRHRQVRIKEPSLLHRDGVRETEESLELFYDCYLIHLDSQGADLVTKELDGGLV